MQGVVLVSLLLTLNIFHKYFSVSIANFEQVNDGLVRFLTVNSFSFWLANQRCTENPARHLRWSFLRKSLTALSLALTNGLIFSTCKDNFAQIFASGLRYFV